MGREGEGGGRGEGREGGREMLQEKDENSSLVANYDCTITCNVEYYVCVDQQVVRTVLSTGEEQC